MTAPPDTIVKNQDQQASIWRMLLPSVLVLLPGFTGGAAISYGAVALPFYMDPDNDSGLVMTKDQATWFISLNSPMQMVGNLLTGFLMDRYGRKLTLVMSSVVVVIASAILSFAPSYPFLLLGCLLNGSSVGCIRPAVGLYISEIATVRWRGCLASTYALTPNLGYLYGILVGSQLPLWVFPWVMVVPCIVFLPLSFFIDDTPLWLVKQGRNKEAEAALVKLRGSSYQLQPELKELEALQAIASSEGSPSLVSLFSRRSFLLPVSILSVLFAMHASVGADVISYYSLTLLIFPGVDLSPTVLAVLLQTMFTIGMTFAPLIMSRVNRRPQFAIGCLAVAVIMILLGLDNYFQLSATNPSLNYLPVFLLLTFGITFGLGIGAIPFTLSGELFPHQMRSYGCGTALAFRQQLYSKKKGFHPIRYILAFVQLKIFFSVVSSVGMSGFYWLQALTALLGGGFALAVLPETRDKTFTQLENIFSPNYEEKELV